MLRLSEIFYSIQGEGIHTGRPAIFIRLAGCNLACDFCDTDYSEKFTDGPYGVYMRVCEISKKYPVDHVIITGGEPMIQDPRLLHQLVCLLRRFSFHVAIETNGTRVVELPVNWLTVSPKSFPLVQTYGNELKAIYTGQPDHDIDCWENYTGFKSLVLQPCWVKDRVLREKYMRGAVRFVKKNAHLWRLGLQCQRYANIR